MGYSTFQNNREYGVEEHWLKEINVKWDADSYRIFRKKYGQEFLPECYECLYDSVNNITTIKMEYIDGVKLTPEQYDPALRYVAYKILPACYEFSKWLKGIYNPEKSNLLYSYNDYKFDNFLIKDNKLTLIDIDSWNRTEHDEIDDQNFKIYDWDFKHADTKRK